MTLQAVTWATVAAVVGSALWLAVAEPSAATASPAGPQSPLARAEPAAPAAPVPPAAVPVVLQSDTHPHRPRDFQLRVELAEVTPRTR
jgi:hypothetical protein